MKRLLFILAIVVLSLAILAPLTGAFVVGSGLLALAVVVAGLAEGIRCPRSSNSRATLGAWKFPSPMRENSNSTPRTGIVRGTWPRLTARPLTSCLQS